VTSRGATALNVGVAGPTEQAQASTRQRDDVTFSVDPGPWWVMDEVAALVGWQQSIEAVYRADADRLWRALLAYAGDPDIASESVAEAYAQALRRGPAVRDPAAWTWRAAFRIAAGALKVRRAVGALPDESATDQGRFDRYADPDLLAALRQLPDAQRAAVILFYYADLPVREIAARLGSNGLAVRANLSRGRRRLHDLLGGTDG
jgi:RNA polymerase sigma-70 factor, ECF subfamily